MKCNNEAGMNKQVEKSVNERNKRELKKKTVHHFRLHFSINLFLIFVSKCIQQARTEELIMNNREI